MVNYLTAKDIKDLKDIKEVYQYLKKRVITKISNQIDYKLETIEKILLKDKDAKNVFSSLGQKFVKRSLIELIYYNKVNKSDILNEIDNIINDTFNLKFQQHMITFGDIMLLTLYSLQNYDDFRNHNKEYFKHIFVDEYQDTNIIQGEILQLLYNENNICVIGDPYQSIYGFLGANIENILTANKIFNGKTIQLLENYRSNANIVKLTNYLGKNMIKKVEGWIPCMSSNLDVKNKKVSLLQNLEDDDQAQYVVNQIQKASKKKKIGIICRNGNVFQNGKCFK